MLLENTFKALVKQINRCKDRTHMLIRQLEDKCPNIHFFFCTKHNDWLNELNCLKTIMHFYYYNSLQSLSVQASRIKKRLGKKIRKAIQDPRCRGYGFRYYYEHVCGERLDNGVQQEPLQKPNFVPSRINDLYFPPKLRTNIPLLTVIIRNVNSILESLVTSA